MSKKKDTLTEKLNNEDYITSTPAPKPKLVFKVEVDGKSYHLDLEQTREAGRE